MADKGYRLLGIKLRLINKESCQPVLRNLPSLKRADEDIILLPIHFNISETDLDYIINTIKIYDKT